MDIMSLVSLLLSLSILLLALILVLATSTRNKNHQLPPSSPSLPFIGHLHLFKHPPLHQAFDNLSQKYGPVLFLRLGSRSVVLVSSLSLAEECFTKNDIALANRPKLMLGKHFGYNYTTVITSPYGDHWRNLRRISTIELFSIYRLNMLLSIRKDEIKRMLQKLSCSALEGFVKVEMRPVLTALSFNIMMRMVAGKRYFGDDLVDDEESMEFRTIIKEIVKYGGASNPVDFLPGVLKWIDYFKGFDKKMAELCKKTDKFLQGLVDEKRRKKDEDTAESKNTMIDHLLDLQESQPEYYSDQIIKGLILVILLAGTDTTSVTLEWALSNLANNPDVLDKARNEIDESVGKDRLIDESDLSKLYHLQNIISETLRLKPAAPLLVPHLSSEDCSIGGYHVPLNTIVLVNAWAIHRDPKLWAEPTSFKPDRFQQRDKVQKLILPFGLGRRACPGAPLAQRVVSLTLGSMIQCLDWKRVSDEDVDMSEGRGATLLKVVPLEIMCKARPIMRNVLSECKL